MRILVIGGAGFLGANLVRRCLADPHNQVMVLDSLEPRLLATPVTLLDVWDRIRFVRGSMHDEALTAETIRGQDVIFNCAAQTSHLLSLQDPIFDAQINCIGNLKLLEAIRILNRKPVVVYTSTSTVIGKALKPIVDETHEEKPLDIYSAHKGVAEKYYRIYNRVHDISSVVLRFANLYGPYGKGDPQFGFLNYFIHQAWAGQDIEIFGQGDQTRNVLYVEDAAEILYQAAKEPRLIGETYFATHDQHLTVLQVAEQIVSVFGRGRILHKGWPEERRRIEIENVQISSARLRAITGWQPRYTFDQGLQRTKRMLEMEDSR